MHTWTQRCPLKFINSKIQHKSVGEGKKKLSFQCFFFFASASTYSWVLNPTQLFTMFFPFIDSFNRFANCNYWWFLFFVHFVSTIVTVSIQWYKSQHLLFTGLYVCIWKTALTQELHRPSYFGWNTVLQSCQLKFMNLCEWNFKQKFD